MTVLTRLGAALLVLATALPLVASNFSGGSSCQSSEFWYEPKGCCLPHGGPPSPPSPPKGHDCPPSTWYWATNLGCCAPKHPTPPSSPPPQCKNEWSWSSGSHMCMPSSPVSPPSSHPSGGYGGGHWKRHNHKRAAPRCPRGLDACPITGMSATDYECLDTAAELESCGGCASLGQGQDCTAIPGAWNVGCERGQCAVHSCSFGYKLSKDGRTCDKL